MIRQLLALHDARDEREREIPRRTAYIIRSTRTDAYVGAHFHWVTKEHAVRFEFMTSALAFAVYAGYALDEFTIEVV